MASQSFRVQPHGTFKNGFDLVGSTGLLVGVFDGSAWRERGRVVVGAEEWEFRRDGGRRFALVGPGGEQASADRVSFWADKWRFTLGGRPYDLVKPSWKSRRLELRVGDQPVAVFSPQGMFGTKADVELPADLPPAVGVFVVAVVITVLRRQEAAAAT